MQLRQLIRLLYSSKNKLMESLFSRLNQLLLAERRQRIKRRQKRKKKIKKMQKLVIKKMLKKMQKGEKLLQEKLS